MIDSSIKPKNSYGAFDIIKLFMAVCVIAIHTCPFYGFEQGIGYKVYSSIIYLAVPFFFLVTGYLLQGSIERNPDNSQSIVKSRLKKNIKLYCIWSLIYLPLAIVGVFQSQEGIFTTAFNFVRGYLLIGEHYNSYILWYLLSCIFALLLVYFYEKYGLSDLWRLVISLVIGCFAIIITMYVNKVIVFSGVLDLGFKVLRKLFVNGRIFTGLFYIPLGMYLKKINVPRWLGLALSIAGFAMELFSPGIGFVYEIGRVACATGILTLALTIIIRRNTVKIRSMSTVLYFTHLWVWTIIYTILYKEKTYGLPVFLITTTICLIIALVYNGVYVARVKKQ